VFADQTDEYISVAELARYLGQLCGRGGGEWKVCVFKPGTGPVPVANVEERVALGLIEFYIP